MIRLLVFGGSGSIGRGVLEAASADSRITETRALQRRADPRPLPRVTVIPVADFTNLTLQNAAFDDVDACIFALGTSQYSVDAAEYRRITVDFTLAAARQLAARSPHAAFVFVSGGGADPTGKSAILFARVKGEAEVLLRDVGVGRLVVARPGGIITPNARRSAERWFQPLAHLLEPFAKGLVIRASELGVALIRAGLESDVLPLLENRDLRALARRGSDHGASGPPKQSDPQPHRRIRDEGT